MNDQNKAPLALGILLVGMVAALVFFGLRAGGNWSFDTDDDTVSTGEAIGFGKSPAPHGWGSEELATSKGTFDKGPLDFLLGSFVEAFLNAKAPVVGEALLRFKDDESYQKFLAAAKSLGLDIRGQIPGLRTVRVGANNFSDLKNALRPFADDLDSVAPNTIASIPTLPNDREPANRSTNSAPLGFESTPIAEFLGIPTGSTNLGAGATVAVIDSGIDLSADVFAGRNIRFTDILDPTNTAPIDNYQDGHGTPVTGLIAELAQEADFDIFRVVGEDGVTNAFSIAEAITLAIENNPSVINISLGGPDPNPVLLEAVNQALAAGIPLTVATGNEGQNGPSYPAAYPGVYGITSVDANNQVLDFSNQLLTDGLGFSAPGIGVPIFGSDGVELLGSGTSFSSPIAAAAGIIIAQEFGVTPVEAFTIVSGFSIDRGSPGPDPDYGFGTPDLQAAFWQFESEARNDLVIGSHFIAVDESGNRTLEVPVQNLGNRQIGNFPVDIITDGSTDRIFLDGLQPGEGTSFTVPLPEGTTTIGTLARLPGNAPDARTQNNGIQSTFSQ